MSSYSSTSVTSFGRTRGNSVSSNDRVSPILMAGNEIYVSKNEALKASASFLELEKDRRMIDEINRQLEGSKDCGVKSSTEPKVDMSNGSSNDSHTRKTASNDKLDGFSARNRKVPSNNGLNRYFQNPAKPPRENFDDSSDSEDEPHISRRYLRRIRKREEALKSEILQLQHECACHAAVCRQYRTKFKKVRSLAMAAIAREDNIIEDSNEAYEYGGISGEKAESDNEDTKIENKVSYTYIDNELFKNEE